MTLNDAHETLRAYRMWLDVDSNHAPNLKKVHIAMDVILSAYDNSGMTLVRPREAKC